MPLNSLISAITPLDCQQAAYKRVSASSLSGEEADRGSPAVDWASIKAEDKTLVHQACHNPCLVLIPTPQGQLT